MQVSIKLEFLHLMIFKATFMFTNKARAYPCFLNYNR